MSVSITSFGSVQFPSLPSGGTNQGAVDIFCFSTADHFAYAGTAYLDATSHYITRLHKIDRSSNTVVWTVDIGTDASHYMTHAIVDPSGSYIYTARRAGTGAFIEKRNTSDGSVAATSATSNNLNGAWNPGLLRLATISSVTYVALTGNGGTSAKGLFVVKASDMSTVLDLADVSGGQSPWEAERAQFDASGNLWLGGYGRDMIKVTIPSGTVTLYSNCWPTDVSVGDNADSMFFDSTDGTMVVGDENRCWRKIGNLSTTPSQTQVMESSDWPNNLYQDEFSNLWNSANQEGFGSSGTELQAVSCLGNTSTAASYSIFLKHTDALSDVVVFGQNGNQGQAIAGPLFNAAGYWTVDSTATNIIDLICDNTSTNPHAGGLTLWTLQPTGTATRWEWFDVSISTPPSPTLNVSATSLSFTPCPFSGISPNSNKPVGAAPGGSFNLTVSNSGGAGSMLFTVTSDVSWMIPSPISGDAGSSPVTVTITLNMNGSSLKTGIIGLADGSYTGHITVNASSAGSVVIPVQLTVAKFGI